MSGSQRRPQKSEPCLRQALLIDWSKPRWPLMANICQASVCCWGALLHVREESGTALFCSHCTSMELGAGLNHLWRRSQCWLAILLHSHWDQGRRGDPRRGSPVLQAVRCAWEVLSLATCVAMQLRQTCCSQVHWASLQPSSSQS